jgi:hypothetical protein
MLEPKLPGKCLPPEGPLHKKQSSSPLCIWVLACLWMLCNIYHWSKSDKFNLFWNCEHTKIKELKMMPWWLFFTWSHRLYPLTSLTEKKNIVRQ